MKSFGIQDRIQPDQRGFSLVELMIAITIGFVIVGAIGYLFIGSRQSFRTTDAISRIQENARYALQTFVHDARMAGNPGCGLVLPTTTQPVTGTDFGAGVVTLGGITQAAGDRIQIVGGAIGDCAYSAGVLTASAPDTVTYFVGTNQSGGRSLYRFSAAAGTAVELADNVWDMQVLYLVNGANAYVSAGSPPAWASVAAVRINLLMVSADNALSSPQTYQYFADAANLRSAMTPAAGAADRLRLHLVFTTTVGLRNRLP